MGILEVGGDLLEESVGVYEIACGRRETLGGQREKAAAVSSTEKKVRQINLWKKPALNPSAAGSHPLIQ